MLAGMDCLPELVETPRLTLRLWTVRDAPAQHAAVITSADHLRPWLPWMAHEPLSIAEREALITEWRHAWLDGGDAIYGVFARGADGDGDGDDDDDGDGPAEAGAGEVVGGTGLHRRLGPGGLEIGYWIHVDHVGQGYATELALALTSAGLALPGIHRIEIHHDRANVISGRVPQRLGYTWQGAIDREPVAPAESGVTWVWRMTAADWARRSPPATGTSST